jgi:hypothetical protein
MAVLFERVYDSFKYGHSKRGAEGKPDIRKPYSNDGYLRESALYRKWPGCKELLDFGDTVVRHINYYEDKATNEKKLIAVVDDGTTVTAYTFDLFGKKTSLGNVASATGSFISSDQLRGATASVLVLGFSKTSPQQFNGTTLAALTGWPPTYPTTAVTEVNRANTELLTIGNPWIVRAHNSRINLSGDKNNPDEIYQSALNRADVYTPSGTTVGRATYLSITDGDSKGGIRWLESWKGRLVAFKKAAIALIDGFHDVSVAGTNPYRLATQPLEQGSDSPYSIVKTQNDIRYLDNKGIYRSINADLANISDLRSTDLSYDVQEYFEAIPTHAYPYVIGVNYLKKNYIWLGHHKGFTQREKTDNTSALWNLDRQQSAAAASGYITFSVNPTAAATITINSVVFTFIAGSSTATDIHIGTTLAATLEEAAAVLNASVNASVTPATYSATDTRININYDTVGTAGNSFTLAASVATVSAATLTGGLAGTGFNDSSGYANTLTNNGTVTQSLGFNLYQDGCIKLNGTNQWLSSTTATNNGTAYTDLSVECEINPSALPSSGNTAYVIAEDTAAGKYAIYLKNNSGTQQIVFSVWDSSNTERSATYNYTTPVTWNTWTSITGTWDGTTLTLYVNGEERNTAACASIRVAGSNGVAIGSSTVAGANYFAGKIDDVRVQNTNIDYATISTFYNGVSRRQNRVQALDYGTVSDKGSTINGWDMVSDQAYITAACEIDNYLLTGTSDGKILLEYTGDTRGLSGRPARLTLGWDDLGQYTDGSVIPRNAKDKEKQITEIIIEYAGTEGGKLITEVAYTNDMSGGSYEIDLINDASTGWGSEWGTAEWGTGEGRRQLSNLPDQPIYPYNCGKKFQITLHTWLENKPIDIIRVLVKGKLLN